MSAPIVERISYGNLRPPRRPGVLGLGMAASVCGGIAAIVVVVMLMFAGILAALVTLVVLTLVLLPLVIHGRDGHTGYEKILAATLFRRADRAGKTKYVSGVTGQTPDGCTRLPGLLAATELVSGTDVYGEEFGVLITPAIEHYSIVFQTEATGAEMVNQSVTDNEVAHHGGWLAQLSQEADVVAAAVTVETAPDPGTRLVRMMNRHRQDDAPEFSGATMDEIAQKYPVASSSITTRVAVTFNGKPRAGEQTRSRADMLDYLARRLPGFRSGLTTTGAGTAVRAMGAADLTDAARVAYDPSVAQLVEEERAAGGTGLTWSEAGPAYAREFPEHYSHDGAHSISWHMKEPPSGVFYDQVLRDLLKPHGDIDRKRVTLVYRPEPAAQAQRIVEKDIRDATTQATSRGRPQQVDLTMLDAARKSAKEQATGAGVVRFGMIVTATVIDEAMLPRAASTVRMLADSQRIRLRLARYNQAATFAAGLPLGLVLPAHLAVPDWMRDAL